MTPFDWALEGAAQQIARDGDQVRQFVLGVDLSAKDVFHRTGALALLEDMTSVSVLGGDIPICVEWSVVPVTSPWPVALCAQGDRQVASFGMGPYLIIDSLIPTPNQETL